MPPSVRLRCARDYVHARLRRHAPPRDHREQAEHALGRGLVDLFVEPYARKRLALGTREIHPAWTARIPSPTAKQILWDGLVTRNVVKGLDTTFHYPASGGIERLSTALASLLPPAAIHVDDELVELDLIRRRATFRSAGARHFATLVSSVSLNELLSLIRDLPPEIEAARAELVWASTYVVNLGLDRPAQAPKGITRYPERHIPFYRLSFPGTYATDNAPAGHDIVVAEVGYHAARARLTAIEAEASTIAALRALGILSSAADVVESEVVSIEVSHVIHGHRTPAALAHVRAWLERNGIYVCGKYGEWRELLMPQSVASGIQAAERVLECRS